MIKNSKVIFFVPIFKWSKSGGGVIVIDLSENLSKFRKINVELMKNMYLKLTEHKCERNDLIVSF